MSVRMSIWTNRQPHRKCKTYLKKTLDDCRKGKEWKKGGSIIHDGIKYESAVRVNDHLWCQNASADLSDYVQLELSKYKEAAEDFCGSDISRKAGKEVDKFTSSLPSLSSKINLSINMGDSQGGCLGPKEYKPSKEECVEKFMKIVGNCTFSLSFFAYFLSGAQHSIRLSFG